MLRYFFVEAIIDIIYKSLAIIDIIYKSYSKTDEENPMTRHMLKSMTIHAHDTRRVISELTHKLRLASTKIKIMECFLKKSHNFLLLSSILF